MQHQPSKVPICYDKTVGDQCMPFVNGIMISENAPKKLVKSFTNFANTTKELMNENQQRSVQQELENTQWRKWREGR